MHHIKLREKSLRLHKSEEKSSESEILKTSTNQNKNLEYTPNISSGPVKEKKSYDGLDHVQCYKCQKYGHLAKNCKVDSSE